MRKPRDRGPSLEVYGSVSKGDIRLDRRRHPNIRPRDVPRPRDRLHCPPRRGWSVPAHGVIPRVPDVVGLPSRRSGTLPVRIFTVSVLWRDGTSPKFRVRRPLGTVEQICQPSNDPHVGRLHVRWATHGPRRIRRPIQRAELRTPLNPLGRASRRGHHHSVRESRAPRGGQGGRRAAARVGPP